MSLYKRILVGVDLNSNGVGLTRGALDAAEAAISEAKNAGASLVVMHSTRPDETRTQVAGAAGIVHEGLSDEAKKAIDAVLADASAAGVDAELCVTEGRPWMDMIQMAVRGEVDLVVVGKRNEATQDGRRLGSVATKLLRKCPCPVLVIRPDHKPASDVIIAATDLSPTGDRVVRMASAMADSHGWELHAVHAYSTPFAMQMEAVRMTPEEVKEQREKLGQEMVDEIEQAVGAKPGEHPIAIHIGRGAPSAILQEAVDHLKPAMLVMGTLSYTGIAGLLVGSTAERMLDRVDCSILAIKPEDFVSPIKG